MNERLTSVRQLIQEFSDMIGTHPSDLEVAESFFRHCCNEGLDYIRGMLIENRHLAALLNTLKALNSEKNPSRVLELILDTAITLTGAERGFLLAQELQIARNFEGLDIEGEYKISRSLADEVARTGTPVLTADAQADEKLSPYTSVYENRLRSVLCVPFRLKEQRLGVVYLDNRLVRAAFQPSHLDLLIAFADQSAIALANAHLNEERERRSREVSDLNEALAAKVASQSAELDSARILLHSLPREQHYHNIYARSSKMGEIFRLLEKIKPTSLPVLILGESGTGKELIAQAIHFGGPRQDQPWVSENCAAIPESLFESELFGHEKGAFSGATERKKGLLECADGGTLFLDEIGELTEPMQRKLLRVLEEKKVRRIGSDKAISLDVRLVSASNRDLAEMVKEKTFREDLYYRINVITLHLPPLRERREDIPLLIEHFLSEMARLTGTVKKEISAELLSLLMGYSWPGNVRQLRNEIQRLAALSGRELNVRYLSPAISGHADYLGQAVRNLTQLLEEVEKTEILKALANATQNKSQAARLLGISRFTLLRKMAKHGLLASSSTEEEGEETVPR